MRPIVEVEIFDLWVIDFMGPFAPSDGKEHFGSGGLCVQVGPGDPH